MEIPSLSTNSVESVLQWLSCVQCRTVLSKVIVVPLCRHIREHMKNYMDDVDQLKLSDKESREFHYFKLHDYDNNNKLDGLELGAAMTHAHGHSEGGQENENVRNDVIERIVVSV